MSDQTSEKKMRVPELRFPEFRNAGEWRKKHLGKVATVSQGYGFPIKYQGETAGHYPFYKVRDISNAVLEGSSTISESQNYISQSVAEELKAKPIPIGSTIFAKIGEAIKLNRRVMLTKPAIIDNNIAGLTPIEGEATELFLFYLFFKVELAQYAPGVIPSVSKLKLENISIILPKELEQQRIADCLSSLDDLITAEDEKLKSLKNHKKGLLQKLFPAEGKTTPEFRFPEFQNAGSGRRRRLEMLEVFITARVRQSGRFLMMLQPRVSDMVNSIPHLIL